jgi:DNA-binding LytR/AlgR family response regulator
MKVVIFEDELHNAERLIRLLELCDKQIEVLAVIESVAEGIQWLLQGHQADLFFMDIRLSDGICFELFGQVEVRTPIVFTTAYDSFALQAFKVNSIDYLMKPLDVKDVMQALEKYRYFKPASVPMPLDIYRLADEFLKRNHTRFLGRINNQLIYVKAQDMAYLQYVKGVTWATTIAGQRMPLDYSMDQVERMLDRNLFFRINRQFIINLDAIKKITTYYNSRLILQLNPHVDIDVVISREKVADFKGWLEGKSMSA